MQFLSPVLALLVLLGALSGWGFLYLDIMSSVDKVAVAEEELIALAQRDSFAKVAEAFVGETGTEQAAVAAFIIPAEATASAIELVEDASRKAKVDATVDSATIKDSGAQHHEQLDVVVIARGAFKDLVRFASLLEALPSAASVTSARFESADKGWLATYTISFVKRKPL
ncbi:MAG: hypothetical protein AAB955_03130 [Patescibacteria group bacterium]